MLSGKFRPFCLHLNVLKRSFISVLFSLRNILNCPMITQSGNVNKVKHLVKVTCLINFLDLRKMGDNVAIYRWLGNWWFLQHLFRNRKFIKLNALYSMEEQKFALLTVLHTPNDKTVNIITFLSQCKELQSYNHSDLRKHTSSVMEISSWKDKNIIKILLSMWSRYCVCWAST